MNLPEGFIEEMERILPSEVIENYLDATRRSMPKSIRINPAKAQFKTDLPKVPWAEHGYYLTHETNFALDPLWHCGAYYVQEASSMILEAVFRQLPLPEKTRALDLSAAPGGKSTHLISLLPDDAWLVSNEIDNQRCAILAENMAKWGYPNVSVTQADPATIGKYMSGVFDVILVDAPCSGEGMFRKDNPAIEHWNNQLVEKCETRQKNILENIWPALREGGYLIYSTCTFNQHENEDVVCSYPDFELGEFVEIDFPPSWNVLRSGPEPVYRLIPGLVEGEGLTITVLKKTERHKPIKMDGKRVSCQKEKCQQVLRWTSLQGWELAQEGNSIFQYHPDHIDLVQQIEKHIPYRFQGLWLGSQKKKDIIPSEHLALSNKVHMLNPPLDLDREEALQYLRRQTFDLEGPEGLHIVAFKRHNLGWIKKMQHRFNNYYPNPWRLRMEIPQNLMPMPFELL